MTNKPQSNKLMVLALAALIPAGGCVWGSVLYDRTLEKETIKNIQPGKTSRMNIIEWFGPPTVLANKDDEVLLPPLDTGEEEMRKVSSQVFFKYFLKRHAISEDHVVYYYFNEGEDINGFAIPIPLGATFVSLPATYGDLQLSELWVLVNRKTGKVEDYVYLESKEK